MKKRLPWVWAAVLSCVLASTVPSLAADPNLSKNSCVLEDPDGYRGLRRTDAFAPGEVVLTFDDGPQPGATRRLLDLLNRHRLQATFFVVGQLVRRDTYHLIQRMVENGHTIGTHTYSHDLALTSRGWGIDYVEGQYELAHVLIEIALLARSPQDFDELYRRVVGHAPGAPLSEKQVRTEWHGISSNHLALLAERGFGSERRVYPMLFARPPGGHPYEGHWPEAEHKEHEAALRRLGLLNVLWHGGSGDTVKSRLDDVPFLVGNVRYHTKKGGILLVHDRMRHDAMEASIARMAKDPNIRVMTLASVIASKYSCGEKELYASLHAVGRAIATRGRQTGREGS